MFVANLEVKIKNVYGKDLIYPNCHLSRIICNKLMKKQTFSNGDINYLKVIGYTLKVESQVL